MRNLPQELVDAVIDHLAEDPPLSEEPGPDLPISEYSTVSHQWVDRTQKHHFHLLRLTGRHFAEKWCAAVKPDPSSVSRHVRRLSLMGITTLKDFDGHIRAFTRIQEVDLTYCYLLRSLPNVRSLTLMGSTLVSLKIDHAWTTSHLMATLLAGLPHLRYLLAHGLNIKIGSNPAPLPTGIPFFEGVNSLILSMKDYTPGKLDWVPPSPRFRDLRIEPSFIHNDPVLVNQWLDSSSECLERLTVLEDSVDATFDDLDLSYCTSLTHLGFPVPLTQPGRYADVILPSLSYSSQFSKVVLQVLASDLDLTDFMGWEKLDVDLCRLAKRFKGAHGGRKMEVEVYVSKSWVKVWDSNSLMDELSMPHLEKEATVVVLEHEDPFILCDVDWYSPQK